MNFKEMESCDVLIVGGGIGGLTLGLLLGRKGYDVIIVDQRKEIEPLHKPEIIQPAGLKVLHSLGVLDELEAQEVTRCGMFDFYSVAGSLLCHVDYRALAHEFPYALIAFPHITQSVMLDKLSAYRNVCVRWGCSLSGLMRVSGCPTQATFWEDGRVTSLSASVVVGADGKNSRVREIVGIHAKQTDYPEAFVTLVVHRPHSFGCAVRYFLGRRQILGMFPVSRDRLCVLFMVPAMGFHAMKAGGLSNLKAKLSAVNEAVGKMVRGISDWSQISYMACRTVLASSWVQDGIALMGDAAHACHPHVAQGSTQAMLDALALEPVLTKCFEAKNFSVSGLLPYENTRRPPVMALQRIAHQYAWLWNTGNPVLAWLRDRVFKEIGQRPHLLSKVVETEAGLQATPLTIFERLQAIGVLR